MATGRRATSDDPRRWAAGPPGSTRKNWTTRFRFRVRTHSPFSPRDHRTPSRVAGWAELERSVFRWERFDGGDFSSPERRRPQRDAVASREDFDAAGAEKIAKPTFQHQIGRRVGRNRLSLVFCPGAALQAGCGDNTAARPAPCTEPKLTALKRFHLRTERSRLVPRQATSNAL